MYCTCWDFSWAFYETKNCRILQICVDSRPSITSSNGTRHYSNLFVVLQLRICIQHKNWRPWITKARSCRTQLISSTNDIGHKSFWKMFINLILLLSRQVISIGAIAIAGGKKMSYLLIMSSFVTLPLWKNFKRCLLKNLIFLSRMMVSPTWKSNFSLTKYIVNPTHCFHLLSTQNGCCIYLFDC